MPTFASTGTPIITIEQVGDHFSFVARGHALGLTYMVSGHLSVAAAQRAAAAEDHPHLHLADVLHEKGLHEESGAADQSEEWETYDYEVPEVLWQEIRQFLQEALDKMAK